MRGRNRSSAAYADQASIVASADGRTGELAHDASADDAARSQFSATFDPENKAPMLHNQMTKDAMHSLSGATRNRLIGAVAHSVAGLSLRSVLGVAAFMAVCIVAAHSARADDAGPSDRVETPADARTSVVPAGEKPPVAPDVVPSFATESHIAATIEFGLHALEEEIGREIPRRLVTIGEG
jgi:hypothetical protein